MTRATVDWKHVETLLNVSDKARQWPHLQALHDEAQDHLKDIHNDVSEARKRSAMEDKRKTDVDVTEAATEERKPGPGGMINPPKPVEPPPLNPTPPEHGLGALFDRPKKDNS